MPRTFKPIRLTIEQAASEWSIDRKTLTSRLRAKSIVAGDDGKFSVKQICVAVYMDGDAARAALAVSQKENFDIRNLKLADKLVEPEQCQSLWDAVIIALREKVSNLPITEAARQEILKDLQSIPLNDYLGNNPANNPTETADDGSAEPVTA